VRPHLIETQKSTPAKLMTFKTLLLPVVTCLLLGTSTFAQENIKAFTEPYRSIEIAAPETGTIARLSVEEGDHIKAGAILANLNEEVLTASLAVAKETTTSKGPLKSATADFQMQQERYQKIQGLFNRRHASQTELDRAQAQLEMAAAKVESAEDDLRVRTLEMRRIEAQIEQRRVRSPIDGVVTEIFKDEGEFVSPNDPKVMTVVQLNPLRVIFSVPQTETSRLKVDQSVPVLIEGKELNGIVKFISPTADAQSGTCRVKIQIDNSELTLSSGQACYLKGFTSKRSRRRIAQTSTSLSTSKPPGK